MLKILVLGGMLIVGALYMGGTLIGDMAGPVTRLNRIDNLGAPVLHDGSGLIRPASSKQLNVGAIYRSLVTRSSSFGSSLIFALPRNRFQRKVEAFRWTDRST